MNPLETAIDEIKQKIDSFETILRKKDLINKVTSMLKSYPSYIIIPCDMGSMIYVKRVADKNPIQELMIGPDDVHISSDFINGYALVENTLKVVNQL